VDFFATTVLGGGAKDLNAIFRKATAHLVCVVEAAKRISIFDWLICLCVIGDWPICLVIGSTDDWLICLCVNLNCCSKAVDN